MMFAGHIDEIGLHGRRTSTTRDSCYFAGDRRLGSAGLRGPAGDPAGRGGPVRGVIGKKAIHLMKKDDREKVSKPGPVDRHRRRDPRRGARRAYGWAIPGCWPPRSRSFPTAGWSAAASTTGSAPSWSLEALRLLAADGPAGAASRRSPRHARRSPAPAAARAPAPRGSTPRSRSWWTSPTATDYPGADKKRKHGDHKLGGGPVLPAAQRSTRWCSTCWSQRAEAEKIPYSIQAAPRDTGDRRRRDLHRAARHGDGLVSVPTATCTARTRWWRWRTWTARPGCWRRSRAGWRRVPTWCRARSRPAGVRRGRASRRRLRGPAGWRGRGVEPEGSAAPRYQRLASAFRAAVWISSSSSSSSFLR